jgi:hypothetical protein
MWDAQNMYVSVGEAGGLAALVCYIWVISRSFSRLGEARTHAKDKKQEWLIWFLGGALFANVVAFFGVNYFDQSRIAWFALVAMICACTTSILNPERTFKSAEGVGDLQVIPTPFGPDPALDTELEAARSISRHLFD